MAGIYADEGISGTKMENRPEFLRMIDDALAGKINLIFCKSISRFGRNAAQCQEMVRKLKANKVEVIFEREQLSSFDPMSEMVFNFLTIIAEEESKSISENTVWGLERQAEKGIRKLGSHKIFGYDEIDGILTPNKYAVAVKMVFEEYAVGTPPCQIVKYLKQMGVKTPVTHRDFNHHKIWMMIKNEVYKGDRIIQKRPHQNYLTHKPDPTRPYKQIYVKGAHEPIVSEELWEKCQEIRRARANNKAYNRPKEKSPVRIRGTSHPLYGRIFCGECGSPMERVTSHSVHTWKKMWRCKKRYGECHNKYIDEDKIMDAVKDLNIEFIKRINVFHDNSIGIEMIKHFDRIFFDEPKRNTASKG